MLGTTLLQGGMAFGASRTEAAALKAKTAFDSASFNMNANFLELSAKDSVSRGNLESTKATKRGESIIATQRATMAANGIDVDSGTAALLQDETLKQAAYDSMTIKNNAFREAMGYRSQAANARAQADIIKITGKNQVDNTLLAGGLAALSASERGYSTIQSSKISRAA